MATQELTSTHNLQELAVNLRKDQYTLWQILGIWLAGGAPMWLLGWVAYPVMSAGLPAIDASLLRIRLLTGGLIWQFVLAMGILYREEGNIRLSTIRRRFWLNHPVSARTGETKKALWWWIIPLFLLAAFVNLALKPPLVDLWGKIVPFLAEPKGYDMSSIFTPELRAQWVGAWGLLGLFFVFALFNSVLGEEFLFRGVLLPKMQGTFGKWDWVANGVIFGLYHLHQPWGILDTILTGWIMAFSGKRFRSNWFPIILHSGETVFILFLILGLVLGLA
ncbi:MAG TPA: CPBP family intramembrane glutamic endopeptidase [Anaerolineales bacterium]|nr:CPBP family intramembrane glutamic endopeptidase [Anaerolineales bacterium]